MTNDYALGFATEEAVIWFMLFIPEYIVILQITME